METAFVKYFLVSYFFLFFGIAVLWRNFVVSKKTGINAFKLNKKVGAESITGLYFKILPLISVLTVILYAFLPEAYAAIGPVTFIESEIAQWIGMFVMSSGLIWVVTAQSQMGTSWRIGIDLEAKTQFVQKGLFQYSRNPIFVGIIFISFGFFLILPNAISLTILMLDIALIQVQVALEEEYLTQSHGDAYLQYCSQIRRWL